MGILGKVMYNYINKIGYCLLLNNSFLILYLLSETFKNRISTLTSKEISIILGHSLI